MSSQWPQLGVEVVDVLERAGQEEVLPDVAVLPLDLPLVIWEKLQLFRAFNGRYGMGKGGAGH